MPAFNARLRPKEFFGLPLYAVGTAVLTLLVLFPVLLTEMLWLRVVSGVVALLLSIVTVLIVALGDEFQLLSVRFQHIADRNASPLEVVAE